MNAACGHKRAPASAADVGLELARAKALCAERGQRWTEPRNRVYELLLQAGGPVKAYDLMDAYAEGRTAKPPTVYRALEFLEQQGLAHRIASLNAYASCAGHDADHVAAFLICECCGSAEEFVTTLGRLLADETAQGFEPRTAALEVRGLCGACAR